MKENYGPYHLLYQENQCLWQNHVGLMVTKFVQLHWSASAGTALDLGGGEGDNSIFLAEQGWNVHFVELSPLAIAHFQTKLKKKSEEIISMIHVTQGSSLDLNLGVFDLVVAYGLLHCFGSEQEFKLMCNRINKQVKTGGYIIISTLIDEQVSSEAHPELVDNFIPSRPDINNSFSNMRVVEQEVEKIVERHGSGPEHQHYVFRAIYQSI